MSVVSLAIYAASDPNGTPLVTLTDNDVASFEMRVAENELGAGKFTIRRDHASATAANLAAGNYVKVTIPACSANPVFGFWLDEQDDTILARNEEGAEVLQRSGSGTLAILRNAALLDDFYNGPLGGAARGNYSVPGYWTWETEPYGAILVRLIEEGQLEPGLPLGEVTIDFIRTADSNSVAWPDIEELIQFPIGTDGLTVYSRLIQSGHLFVVADPDLTIHGYGSPPGEDRASATFATGKVRFEKGINIMTELVREGHGSMAATHALVVGKDNTYRQVVSGLYSTPPGRWVTVDYDNSNDTDLLDNVGANDLQMRTRAQDGVEFEIRAGDSELDGQYLPFKHFNIGDDVTLHTGTTPWDYNEESTRFIGTRIVLDEVSDDSSTDLAARSLRVVVELTWGPTTGKIGAQEGSHGMGDCPFWTFDSASSSFMRMRAPFTNAGASGRTANQDAYLHLSAAEAPASPSAADLYAFEDRTGEGEPGLTYAGSSHDGRTGVVVHLASGWWESNVDGTAPTSRHHLNGGWGLVFSSTFGIDPDPDPGDSSEGQLRYNETDHEFHYFDGTAWQTMGGGGGGGSVGTDVLFDAKGDLAVGTGADTADNLTVGANGAQIVADSAATTGLRWRLNNDAGTVAPAATDDDGDGYAIGSRWLDLNTSREYVCLDASTGAAFWQEVTGPFEEGAGASVWRFKSGINQLNDEDDFSFVSLTNADLVIGAGSLSITVDDKHRMGGGNGHVVPLLASDPAGGDSEAGQIYFNTGSGTFRGHDGTVWGELPLI